jgi:hypothetical protein
MRPLLPLGLAVSILAVVGCAKERVNSLGGDSSSSSTTGGSTTGSGPAPTPVRQVYERNPWGGPANNLLVDGDFELSVPGGTGQYGWVLFTSPSTQGTLVSETGGTCKTGIRCALASAGQILFGRGTAPANMAPSHASVYAKPVTPPAPDANPASVCNGLFTGAIVECDTSSVVAGLKPAAAPDGDGFCEYSADVPGETVALCMYLDLKEDAIVDTATLLPTTGATAKSAPFEEILVDPERLRQVGDYIRAHRRFGEPRHGPSVREDLR